LEYGELKNAGYKFSGFCKSSVHEEDFIIASLQSLATWKFIQLS